MFVKQNHHLMKIAACMVCCLVLLAGCTVKLIADYDQQTDKAVTELHRKFAIFFVGLGTQIGSDAANYENYGDFYKDIKVDISAIKLRVSAIPKNEITLSQVSLLEQNVVLLEETHKEGIADIALIMVLWDDFNTALSNILRLELAKQRGQEG